MELSKIEDKKLEIILKDDLKPSKQKKQDVLDEETYVEVRILVYCCSVLLKCYTLIVETVIYHCTLQQTLLVISRLSTLG